MKLSDLFARQARLWQTALGLAMGFGVVAATLGACGGPMERPDPCPDDPGVPVSTVCEQLVPQMCTRAVIECKEPGTVDDCIARARPRCCQGACGRAICTPDMRRVLQCLQAYVSPDASVDAEIIDPLPVPPTIGCDEVLAGFSPPACVDIAQLK